MLGVVVIGLNEGERLRRCLASLRGAAGRQTMRVVYVDSGSSDGSPATARNMGADVIALDSVLPFTAARARNAGFRRLLDLQPATAHVQFIDGDCELAGGWLQHAVRALRERPRYALVTGRLHERHPEASIYNRLGDLEWNFFAPGEVVSVGGIFLVRRDAFESVDGFDPSVAAGEEPELCLRLRQRGWRLWRLDCDMAWHDLAMTRFAQWWRRQRRNGYGSLDVARRFGVSRFRRSVRRVWAWMVWTAALLGVAVFTVHSGFTLVTVAAVAALAAVWPLQLARIALRTRRRGRPWMVALAYAFYTQLSFWAQAQGHLRYGFDVLAGRGPRAGTAMARVQRRPGPTPTKAG